jgi:2,3-bisphosphoglycerate-dependent phosphoglycerate mutase
MNNLILVRHGQSKFNLQRRFTGFYDAELASQGEAEAKYAGELIKKLNIEFDAYFTSQLIRASKSLNIILKTLNKSNVKINKAWELNERHYGGLTGLNKDETIKKYGMKQVKIWRRSFDTPPPQMEANHPYKNKINSNILGESLKDTFERVIPFFNKKIKPLILSSKNILIVFHGNSCRALLMKILNISQKKIINLEIPTGNPLLIRFENNLQVKDYKYLDEKRAKKILFNI